MADTTLVSGTMELDKPIDEETDAVILRVVNNETGEVIRQIPPEERIEVSRKPNDLFGPLVGVES